MNCLEANRSLRAQIDGEAPGAPIAEHLAVCRACQDTSQRLRSLIADIQALPPVRAPEGFLERLEARLQPAAPAAFPWFGRGISRRAALTVALAAACAPLAVDAVQKALQLNRWGKWSEAAKVAAEASGASGSPLETRCASIVSAAYANARLDRDSDFERFTERFAQECRAVAPESWMRREMDKLRVEYTQGSPAWLLKRAMRLNQKGDWPLAGIAADAVLAGRTASTQERCEAYFDKSYALTRMRDPKRAVLAMKAYDAQCRAVPKGHWMRRETAKLKAELMMK